MSAANAVWQIKKTRKFEIYFHLIVVTERAVHSPIPSDQEVEKFSTLTFCEITCENKKKREH